MNKRKLMAVLASALLLVTAVVGVACNRVPAAVNYGVIAGAVTIGPVFPGPTYQGDTRPVPADVFNSRKIMIYDSTGKDLVQKVDIHQIGQTANGYYLAQLKPGTYVVDIQHGGVGGSSDVPKTVTVSTAQAVTLNINIDTGIR